MTRRSKLNAGDAVMVTHHHKGHVLQSHERRAAIVIRIYRAARDEIWAGQWVVIAATPRRSGGSIGFYVQPESHFERL